MKLAQPKLLIIGESRHGKDTVCNLLKDCYKFKYESPSAWVAEQFIRDAMKLLGLYYTTNEQCYADRHNHKQLWKDLIAAYNNSTFSGIRLFNEIMRRSDIYNGVRKFSEYTLMMETNLIDVVVYVDAHKRRPVTDSICEVPKSEADFVIDNNGDENDLILQLDSFIAQLYNKLGRSYIVEG